MEGLLVVVATRVVAIDIAASSYTSQSTRAQMFAILQANGRERLAFLFIEKTIKSYK